MEVGVVGRVEVLVTKETKGCNQLLQVILNDCQMENSVGIENNYLVGSIKLNYNLYSLYYFYSMTFYACLMDFLLFSGFRFKNHIPSYLFTIYLLIRK